MAKYETRIKGNIDEFLKIAKQKILDGSISASLEEESFYQDGDFRCAIVVFERYSYTGKNRVSLTLVVIEKDEELFISAITSGGSQALFIKINIFGEEAFLEKLVDIVEEYRINK